MFRRMLVPTDGSEFANQTAAAAIRLASETGATVVAVSVVQPLASIPFYEGVGIVGAGADDLLAEQARKRADDAVEAVCAAARGAGVACEARVRDAESVSHGIVEAANDYGCDLIFIGSHGRRGLTGLLMGSVTRAVLPYAHVPVLVWRT